MTKSESGADDTSSEPGKVRTSRSGVLSRDIYAKQKVIFSEGTDGNDIFILESGRVGVFKNVGGKEVQLATLEKGAIFGEMAAIAGGHRSATTIAIEPSVLVRIPRTLVQTKLNVCDPFLKAIIEILINNVNRSNERYVSNSKLLDRLIGELKRSAENTTTTSPKSG